MSAPPAPSAAPAAATARDAAAFIRDHTQILAPPLVPEIRLHQATEVTGLWQATETALDEMGLPPPFWAFAWAGGQALARWLLDRPETVRGRTVLDFATGSGLVAIAAVMAGAKHVIASEVDRFAVEAARLNAALNGVAFETLLEDVAGRPNPDPPDRWDVVLAGDICYEQKPAARMIAWLRGLVAQGTPVYLGDPNRTFLPKTGLEPVARYAVPTTRAIEDTDVRNAVVWRVLAKD